MLLMLGDRNLFCILKVCILFFYEAQEIITHITCLALCLGSICSPVIIFERKQATNLDVLQETLRSMRRLIVTYTDCCRDGF